MYCSPFLFMKSLHPSTYSIPLFRFFNTYFHIFLRKFSELHLFYEVNRLCLQILMEYREYDKPSCYNDR